MKADNVADVPYTHNHSSIVHYTLEERDLSE